VQRCEVIDLLEDRRLDGFAVERFQFVERADRGHGRES
jgi:hypothetical protein